ncbi:hypothetical protein [Enterococcus avium]|uniref:hypothetical protein n=1 Tax=Enterococcus avium TaxID=33945 RepID=UPI0032E44644
MELLKLIKNRISTEWKETFNKNVDILNRNARDQDQKLETLASRISNLVLHSGGDSPNEVVDARVNNKAVQFPTLAARLLDTENTHDKDVEQLSLTQADQQKQLEQLNNSIGIILGTFNASVSIYVSKTRGNDQTGDGTEEKPLKTIQMAANLIPLLSTGTVTIFVDADVYLEDVVFKSINGTQIFIRPIQDWSPLDPATSDMPVKIRSANFTYCTGYFRFSGVQFVDLVNAPQVGGRNVSLSIVQGGYLSVSACKFAENSKAFSSSAVYTEGNSKVSVTGKTYFKDQYTAMTARHMGEIYVENSTQGTGNNIGVFSDLGTIRCQLPSGFATTQTQTGFQGLIITKGTVLS